MDAKWHVILSGTLTFGVPLALAVRELIILRRPQGGAWRGDDPTPTIPRPLPPNAPRRLPDCLIPKLVPSAQSTRAHTPEPV